MYVFLWSVWFLA